MTPLGRLRRWYDVDLEAFRLMAPAVVVGTDRVPRAPTWTG
jgi:hypothetical protein